MKGYCSDMTRTVVLGKADEKMKHVYNTVLEAQLAAIDAAKEGCSLKGLDTIARDIIYGADYEGCFGHGLGHGKPDRFSFARAGVVAVSVRVGDQWFPLWNLGIHHCGTPWPGIWSIS